MISFHGTLNKIHEDKVEEISPLAINQFGIFTIKVDTKVQQQIKKHIMI